MKDQIYSFNDDSNSVDIMHCLICDADIATHNGFNQYSILCTKLHSGTLLSHNVSKTLKRDIESSTTRSTNLCKRCFSLFEELDTAESRCAEIRKEIQSYYTKTCEAYNDEYAVSVHGVACQTEDVDQELPSQESDNKPDIKLKIALPKRKRGRPVKTQSQLKKRNSMDEQNSSEVLDTEFAEKPKRREKQTKKEAEVIAEDANDITEVRRTRSSGRGNARKKNVAVVEAEKEKLIKYEEIEVEEENSSENIFVSIPENGLKEDDSSQDNAEVFTQDTFNNDDDDDFEWKEENATEMNDDSADSDDDLKGEKTNDDDWQSSGSKDSKKKQKKKKKRKRGDRRGERAFMVPIHECNQCGKKWRTVTELKSHIASHSDVRPFVCEICGQAYKMKKALDIHIGMHNGIHPFVCSYCNKSFTQKVGLEKHLPIHTGVTRFQCDLCGKRFIHQKSFNIHKMTHTGEKNIHCPICKLAVFSQSHLKRHYRVHTGERPYGCNICGKKFAEKYNLNAHTRIHDPNSAGEGRRRCHTCPICGVTYDRKHKMVDHLSSAHYIWQSSTNLDFKSEDFYNLDVQQGQNQHHLQQMQPQQQQSLQVVPPQQQQQQQQTAAQQQTHVHQQQPQQPQMNSQQPQQPAISQTPQQAQQNSQMNAGHQPQQHHHMTHHQQQPTSHHLQQHHAQSAAPSHHILVTQHQLQQTLQSHLTHHPVSAAAATVVATATPPPLQPINSVFQLVSVQPSVADPSNAHHNRMNAVTASMAVPTL